MSRCCLRYRVRVHPLQGAGLLNRECWPHEEQTPNQLPGLPAKSARESDGHLQLSDLRIILRDALIVNRAVSRRAPLPVDMTHAAAVASHAVSEKVANSDQHH